MALLYGVVVCSRCHMAKGVRLGQKTTMCQCGHRIDMGEAKVRSKTADPRELAEAVAMENARLRKGLEEYQRILPPRRKARGAHAKVAEIAAQARSREDRIRAVAIELSRALGSFTLKDFALVLGVLGIPDPQKSLGGLLAASFVYEPKQGLYKCV